MIEPEPLVPCDICIRYPRTRKWFRRRRAGDTTLTQLTEAQKDALATATMMAKAGAPGFIIGAHRVADRMTCDGLVKSGHLTAVEGVDGGYRLSDQMLAANAITLARQAEQAERN